MSEEELKRKKDDSMTALDEALESLKAYYSIASAPDRPFDPDQLLSQVNAISIAIGVCKNACENYMNLLEEQVRIMRKRNH
jgi:hypothetical protein